MELNGSVIFYMTDWYDWSHTTALIVYLKGFFTCTILTILTILTFYMSYIAR